MIVGVLILNIHFPYSHSLKEKRKRMLRLRNRLKNKYNVAFAELDFQDKWQRTRIGIVTLNNQRKIIDLTFQQITSELQEHIDGEILSQDIQFY